MSQNPFQPPKDDTPSRVDDDPGDNSDAEAYALQSCLFVLGPLLLIAWVWALALGWRSDSDALFHLVFGALVVVPSIATLWFAFAGREKRSSGSIKLNVANLVGTTGCLAIGICGLAIYVWAWYSRAPN